MYIERDGIILKVMKNEENNVCDLNMGVINLNEEVEKMLYYAGSSKAIRMPTKGRSTRPLDRASSRVSRASRQNISSSFL